MCPNCSIAFFHGGCLLTSREPFRTAIVLEPSAEPQFPLSLKGSIVSIRKEGKLIKSRSRHTFRVRKPHVNSSEHQEHIRFLPSGCSPIRISSARSKSLILCRTRRTTAVVQGTWLLDTHMVRFHAVRPFMGSRIVTA